MSRIVYIDNLRMVLTILVVLQHAAIACRQGACFAADLITGVSQMFLAGFFFFLSGYVNGISVESKGNAEWLASRLIKLGIPLLVGAVFLSVTSFHIPGERDVVEFLSLLLFISLLDVAWRRPMIIKDLPVPAPRTILLFAIGLGIINFLVDAAVPSVPGAGLCLPCFALFVLGRIAFENNWLGFLPYRTGKRLGWEVVLLLLVSPVFSWVQTSFAGGLHWQLLIVSIWKEMIMFSLIVAMVSFGKRYLDKAAIFTIAGEPGSYILFIVHPLVLALLSAAIGGRVADPRIKLLIMAPLTVGGSAALAFVIAKLQVTWKRI